MEIVQQIQSLKAKQDAVVAKLLASSSVEEKMELMHDRDTILLQINELTIKLVEN